MSNKKVNMAKENLCYYDLRNPDVVGIYGLTDLELKQENYGNHKRADCSCENCFYGLTDIAELLLKETKETDQLRKENAELRKLLYEAMEVIEFHVGSSHSDTSKEDEEILESIEKLLRKKIR